MTSLPAGRWWSVPPTRRCPGGSRFALPSVGTLARIAVGWREGLRPPAAGACPGSGRSPPRRHSRARGTAPSDPCTLGPRRARAVRSRRHAPRSRLSSDPARDLLHALGAQPAGGRRGSADPHAGGVERLARIERDPAFALVTIRAWLNAVEASVPVIRPSRPCSIERIRWLSVPPEISVKPRCASASASTLAFATTVCAYSPKAGVAASPSAAAIAASAAGGVRPAAPGRQLCPGPSRAARGTSGSPRAARAASCAWSSMHHIGVRHRRGVGAAGDQPREVRDVGDHQRVDLRGDRGERREVDRARHRRAAAEEAAWARCSRASSRTSSMSTRPVSRRTP